jgi:hypothetical protein
MSEKEKFNLIVEKSRCDRQRSNAPFSLRLTASKTGVVYTEVVKKKN